MYTPDVGHLPLKIIHDPAHPADISDEAYRQQVTAMLRDLRSRGFGGVVTNVSTQYSYLESDREWKLLSVLAGTCTAEGMRLWIYDERGYPSGGAGGVTLRDYPDGEARAVVSVTAYVRPGEVGRIALPRGHEKFLFGGLYACDADGNLLPDRDGHFLSLCPQEFRDTTDAISVLNSTSSPALLCAFAEKRLYEGTHCVHNVFEARRYIDVTNSDAVRAFIANTYERYAAAIPAHLKEGDTAPGRVEAFFTDEPSFMGCYINEGLTPRATHDPYDDEIPLYPVLSWGRDVENQFTSRYGYDLRRELVALFMGSGRHAEQVRFDFWRLMSDLYEQSFFSQISDWCARNHVDFSGHILLEDNIRFHTVFEGNFFHLLRHMHTPGIDMLHSLPPVVRKNAFTPKIVSSVAHAYRRPHVMSEVSAHAQGGNVTHDQMYGSLCAQYALGVDTFTYYYGADFMDPETYTRYNTALGRIDAVMAGTPAPEVFVYYPIETFQLHHRPSAAQYGGYTQKELAAEAALTNVMDGLLDRQCDFDFIDYDVLSASEVHNGYLTTPAGISAQALILPPMEITPDTAALFERLAAAGLRILTTQDTENLFCPAPGARCVPNAADLTEELNADALSVRTDAATPGVLALTRKTASGQAVMLCNTCEEDVTLTLSLDGFRNPEVYDPMADAVIAADLRAEGKRHLLCIELPACRAYTVREAAESV